MSTYSNISRGGIIATDNDKGGVGKSFTGLCLAHCLSIAGFAWVGTRPSKPFDSDMAAPRTGHSDFDWVWDKPAIWDHAGKRQISVNADVRGFAAITPGTSKPGR